MSGVSTWGELACKLVVAAEEIQDGLRRWLEARGEEREGEKGPFPVFGRIVEGGRKGKVNVHVTVFIRSPT